MGLGKSVSCSHSPFHKLHVLDTMMLRVFFKEIFLASGKFHFFFLFLVLDLNFFKSAAVILSRGGATAASLRCFAE
jgi:hypothetical protein